MPRRLGATVPQTVSRLLQGGLLPRPPAWFTAVASVAPLRPSLTKRLPRQEPEPSTSSSSSSSSSSSYTEINYAWKGSRKLKSANAKRQLKYRPAKPAPIKGLELQDKIRKTFYEDHPFEAFRGISLVEQDSILGEASKPGPTGKNWTELRERSSNPSPEDCVDFAVNLHKVHEIPLALAYSTSTSQYHALKASHEIALYSAQVELQAHGFQWPTEFSAIDRRTRAEERNIYDSIKEASKLSVDDNPYSTGAPRVSLLEPRTSTQSQAWTGGLQYMTSKEEKPYGAAASKTSDTSSMSKIRQAMRSQ